MLYPILFWRLNNCVGHINSDKTDSINSCIKLNINNNVKNSDDVKKENDDNILLFE